jgi:hypothetical protein
VDAEALVWGWRRDPWGIHEERWFCVDGAPTKLVRDRGCESYDEVPEPEARRTA